MSTKHDPAERELFEVEASKLGIPDNSVIAFQLWQAARAAAPVEVPGWKFVPMEPTEAMVHAAEDIEAPRPFGKVYRAMIAAAPPSQESK